MGGSAFVMLMSYTMSQRAWWIGMIAVDMHMYFAPRQAAPSASEVILEHPRTLQEVSRAFGHLLIVFFVFRGLAHFIDADGFAPRPGASERLTFQGLLLTVCRLHRAGQLFMKHGGAKFKQIRFSLFLLYRFPTLYLHNFGEVLVTAFNSKHFRVFPL